MQPHGQEQQLAVEPSQQQEQEAQLVDCPGEASQLQEQPPHLMECLDKEVSSAAAAEEQPPHPTECLDKNAGITAAAEELAQQPAEPMECEGGGACSVAGAEEAQGDGAPIELEQHPEQEGHAEGEQERRAAEEKAALEKKEEQRNADVAVVLKAVRELDGVPHGARDTLLAGLPCALDAVAEGDGKALAHGMQANFIHLVASALEDARVRAERGAEEAGGAARAAEQELQACEKELAEKVENAKTAKAEVEEKAAASKASLKRAREAAREHKKAEKDGLAAAQVWRRLREQRERAAAVAEGPLSMLASGGWEDEAAKALAMKAVQEHIDQSKVEKLLAQTAPLALRVPPAKRARFDDFVVDAITKAVSSDLSALNEKVVSIAPEEEWSRALTLGLWALADVTRERSEEAKNVHQCAQVGVGNANADIARAEERLAKQRETISYFASQQIDLDARADEMRTAAAAVARLQSVH